MSSVLREATPFLLQLFVENGIPEAHMYTNCNDRLVHTYSQRVEDQTARDSGATTLPPEWTRWSYISVVITDTDRWNIKAFQNVISKMKKDGTGSAYILLHNSTHICFQSIDRHSITLPVTLKAISSSELNTLALPVVLHVGIATTEKLAVRHMGVEHLTDIRRLLSIKARSREMFNGFGLGRSQLHRMAAYRWLGHLPWWSELMQKRRSCLEYTDFDNEKYMKPIWRERWMHDRHNLPNLDERLRSPAIARAELELPLPAAPNDIFSQRVWATSIAPNPDMFRIVSEIKVNQLMRELALFPNQGYVASWKAGFTEGIWPWADNFGNDVARMKLYDSPNLIQHKRFVNTIRDKELAHDHWRGPYTEALPYYRNSPCSVAPKSEGGNRFIQNQSFSEPMGDSVNDHIPDAEGRVTYDKLSELALVIVKLHSMGRKNMIPWKLDVSRAFRHLPLHPLFALRNGVILKSRTGAKQYFIDSQACFGGRAFPRAYCMFDDLVVWIAVRNFRVNILFHYVDDHYGISAVSQGEEEPDDMLITRKVFALLGVPTNDKDEFGENIVITGVEVNYSKATFQLPPAKLVKYISACLAMENNSRVTVADLQHVIGVLNYSLNVIPYGKVHMQCLYRAKRQYHHSNKEKVIEVCLEMKEDLRWWATALAARPTRYLLEDYWWSEAEADEIIYTDASTSDGMGIYRPSKRIGYIHTYSREGYLYAKLNHEDRKGNLVHVNTVEFLAMLSAVQIVSRELSKLTKRQPYRLIIMSDNISVVETVYKMSSLDPVISDLLRDLHLELEKDIDLRVCHVGTKWNPADHLTRDVEGLKTMKEHFQLDDLIAFEPVPIKSYVIKATNLRNLQ